VYRKYVPGLFMKVGRPRRLPAVIHTDFEKGFIKAEVIAYNDYVQFGSEPLAEKWESLRIEGKEYIVKDGDVMHFRFNV
jgi:ribosome-binding ATPase YchF (GTP1/OBG family)